MLVRNETTPDDMHGIIAAKGVLTAKGGATSHAAVVARGMGRPCVAGCEALVIDERTRTATLGGESVKEGDPRRRQAGAWRSPKCVSGREHSAGRKAKLGQGSRKTASGGRIFLIEAPTPLGACSSAG